MSLKNLYPGRMVSSVYEMDWEKLALTYRGVIFDIDNTLVPHGAPADDRAKELFSRLHGLGMKTALVSNNGEERVRPFAEKVESIYLYKAGTNDQWLPINKAQVELFDNKGNSIGSYQTDECYNGFYAFFNLEPGKYKNLCNR